MPSTRSGILGFWLASLDRRFIYWKLLFVVGDIDESLCIDSREIGNLQGPPFPGVTVSRFMHRRHSLALLLPWLFGHWTPHAHQPSPTAQISPLPIQKSIDMDRNSLQGM